MSHNYHSFFVGSLLDCQICEYHIFTHNFSRDKLVDNVYTWASWLADMYIKWGVSCK